MTSLFLGAARVSSFSMVSDHNLFRALSINALQDVSRALLETPETASILSAYL